MNRIYIGTSGWQYLHWTGVFYPSDLPQKEWLAYYTKSFDTVEVNATFYHQMKKETFTKWRQTVGPDFVFSIKGSRFITHIKRLKDCQEAVNKFMESVSGLSTEAGHSFVQPPHKNVILWQLPPRFKSDMQRLESFLKLLPQTWRQAFEFRDGSWLNPEVFKLLRDFGAAVVFQDFSGWPKTEEVIADFVYLRFHGRQSLYASSYSTAELDEWAKKMKQWKKDGRDIYAFFNNDAQGNAVKNALELKNLLADQ